MAEVREHVVDGIEEYDNPLPSWWLYGFYVSIVFAVIYSVMYPSFWFWNGTARWTSSAQYEVMLAGVPKPVVKQVDLPKLAADPNVVAAGHELFKTYCVACHGDNAEGKVGPPLVPHKWRYGGDPDSILTTIRGGRPGGMPVWGKVLPEEKIETVAAYVYSLSEGRSAPEAGHQGSTASPATTGNAGELR